MSSDFYMKMQTLYEDFQKKELHYLNAERKLNNALMWRKDDNVPLQEHLQKLHEREKKNEGTYQSIMKQMNELDHHTDLLRLKVEKLGIFSNIHVGHNLSDISYPSTSKHIPQSLNNAQNNTEPIVTHFESCDLKGSTLKPASTQTENDVYCDNCRSLIQVSCQSSQIFNNSTSSFIDVLSVSKNKPNLIDSLRSQNDSFVFSNKNNNDSQCVTSSLNEEHLPSQIYPNETNIEKNYKNESLPSKIHEAKSPGTSTVLEERGLAMEVDDVSIAENAVKDSTSKVTVNKSQSKSNDAEVNVEVSMHKSDADSVNHEFDFLESDTAHLPSKPKSQNSAKYNTTSSNGVSGSIAQVTSSEVRVPDKFSVKLGSKRSACLSNKEHEISENKSEASDSVSGTHSPVISLTDSDSINEKGSFTTSAAYQSLLGNAVIPAKSNKEIPESESEDEVERTLARTVERPNKKLKYSVQPKKNKTVFQSIDSKPDVKPKPASVNKPQSKLSKNTKKVLGIDSSSSSEIEAAVKPLENKKCEDSDEFDFYD